jgi:hypothetical protein
MGTLRPTGMSNGEIATRYLAGTSLTELALRCKSTTDTIKRILHAYDVPLRSQREAQALAMIDRRQRTERRRQHMVALGLRQDD